MVGQHSRLNRPMKLEKDFIKGLAFMLGVGFVVLCIPAYDAVRDFQHGEATPVVMTAAELSKNGLGKNGHVKLTDFHTEHVVYFSGGRHSRRRVEADIIPDGPSISGGNQIFYRNEVEPNETHAKVISQCEGYVYPRADGLTMFEQPTVTIADVIMKVVFAAATAFAAVGALLWWKSKPEDESSKL